jgi:capsular polysaccharide biosynthesis protein
MGNNEKSDANVPGGHSGASSTLPEVDPLFSPDRRTVKSPGINSGDVLGRVVGRWRQILLLCLLLSAPIALVMFLLIRPTYEVSSLLCIEPAQPGLLGPLKRSTGESQSSTYLETQLELITSARVIDRAVANSLVANLALIKKSEDPKRELLEKLKVEIIKKTNLIRISLGLPDPNEAVTIVQAVVQSYLTQHVDYNRSANRDLTESLKQQLVKLGKDIDLKRSQLQDLKERGGVAVLSPREMLNPKTETDPTQPTLNRATEAQFSKLIDRQVQLDLDYIDALAQLDAVGTVRQRHLADLNEELNSRILAEFTKDAKVASLMGQIDEARKLGQSQDQPPSPVALAAREKLDRLSKEYQALWADRQPEIRRRLVDENRGLLSDAKIRESEVAVEKARKKKEAFAEQFEKIHVITDKEGGTDTFEADYLNRQINSLMNWEEQVKKNLAQLNFEANQDEYRVVLVDAASAPKIPTNNRRLKYMAAAPVVVFLLLLGLFLVHEIKAGRNTTTGPAETRD